MDDGQHPDEWLMAQVALGKRAHLAELIHRYANSLLTYIQRMIGDLHESEELFQEVFLAVWVKRKTYKYPMQFRPWLYAIATNQCRAAFRKVRKPMSPISDLTDTQEDQSQPAPDAHSIQQENAQLISEAVQQLPPQQRSVIVLRLWNGLTYPQIAEALDCSVVTVRSHMHHALSATRKFLEPRMR